MSISERVYDLFHHNDSDSGKHDIFWTQVTLAFFGTVATLAVFFYAVYAAGTLPSADSHYFNRLLSVFGTVMAVGFASFAGGGILGFLFGIPKAVALETRSRRLPDTVNPALEEEGIELQPYRSNTNLEEISDWLTKIIVGATLIEAKEIIGFFGSVVSVTSTGLAPVPFAKTMTGAVIVGFLVLGFFAIYLMTRLYLASAFSRLEAALRNAFRTQRKIQATVDQKLD